MIKAINLIVQYFRQDDSARQEEIDACLRHNLENDLTSRIHLLTEEEFGVLPFPNRNKIIQTVIGKRLTFEDAFSYANRVDPKGDEIWMLANADIWFDESIRYLADAELNKVFFGLTRHDIQPDGSIILVDPQYAHGSQDAWIFKTPLPLERMFASFSLGIPGCDHRIAHELVNAGYVVLNPSLKIIARHLDLARAFHIDDRTNHYMTLMTEEGFRAGQAAPPPYQFFLYPTDQINLSVEDHFRNFLQAAATIKTLENTLTDRNNLIAWRDTQLAEQRQTIEERERQLTEQWQQLTGQLRDQWQQLVKKDQIIADNEQRIAALYAALASRDQHINSLLTSLSWKITSPLRKLHNTLNTMLGRQVIPAATTSPESAAVTDTNQYILSLITGDPTEEIEPLDRTVDVLLPVYNAFEFTKDCIESVLANSRDMRLIVIDDASTDDRIRVYLDTLQDIPERNIKIMVTRNEENLGFVKTVNRGFGFTENDFVILNSDTEVPSGWLDRLFLPLLRDNTIATVTPFSNAATICSFPEMCEDNPLYLDLTVSVLDGYFKEFAPQETVEIPTGIGFCMAVRRSVVEQIGFFDEERFGRGYGEENDFCIRAKKAGYRNVLAANLFVYHKHGGSFSKSEKASLASGNLEKLIEIYPEYPTLVNAFITADPLKDIRDALKFIIFVRGHKVANVVAVVDFDLGGGSGLYSAGLLNKLMESGHTVIHIKYVLQTETISIGCTNGEGLCISLAKSGSRNIDSVLKLLGVDFVIVNQLVSWSEPLSIATAIRNSGIPYLALLHDYFYICPNWVLLNAETIFCNATGDQTKCTVCFRNNATAEYRNFYGNSLDKDLATWNETMHMFLLNARKVICFSGCSQKVLTECYSDLTNTVIVEHAVPDRQIFSWQKRSLIEGQPLTVGIIGGIGVPKGINIVSGLLASTQFTELPVNIVVMGNTSEYGDGYRSPDGRLFVYGKYSRENLPSLLEKHDVSVVLIPSVWPETFSFTTSEAMLLGYPVVCFDIGAQAERVKRYGCGLVTDEISPEGLVKVFRMILEKPDMVEEMSMRTQRYEPSTAEAHFSSVGALIMD